MELEGCTDHLPESCRSLFRVHLLRCLELARLGSEDFTKDSHLVFRNETTISQRHNSFRLLHVFAKLLAPLSEFLHVRLLRAHHVLDQFINVALQVFHFGLGRVNLSYNFLGRLSSRVSCWLFSLGNSGFGDRGRVSCGRLLTSHFFDTRDDRYCVYLVCYLAEQDSHHQ